MRRRTLRIVLFLVLGCVTTVAVAWGLVLAGEASSMTGMSVVAERGEGHLPRNELIVVLFEPPGATLIWCERRPLMAFRNYANVLSPPDEIIPAWVNISKPLTAAGDEHRVFEARGFPFRALYLEHRGVVSSSGQRTYSAHGSLATGLGHQAFDGWMFSRDLPLRPIWPGFVISTMFYGAIWFGIFFGFGSTRRALRKKRGRCPKCNYDLRGELDKGCSECGWNRGPDE